MPLEALQNGRYRILRPLGSGSMGEVYLVDDTRINRQVAIKVIRTEATPYPDSGTTQDAARLFEREAKSIARLNHPNILPLFDFGEEKVNGTPLTFMVMPYCPDGSLASWLQVRNPAHPLSLQDVAHFLHQAADALQHAHDNGIIHQDVKPQNFLMRSNKNAQLPDLLLADFGIAKLTAGTSGVSQAIRGTPNYMAPEQWEGQPVPASDQYALSVMIYQLLTSRPPFQGGPGQMMYQHFNVIPQPPSAINPALNKDIDAVLLHAMAKRPQDRFATMSAFDQAFQHAMALSGPTMLNTQHPTGGDDIHTTLAISAFEAINGTSRTLILSNGQRIRIVVPSGMQNGQELRVEGQDDTGNNSSIAIPLVLTIVVATSDANFPSIPISGDKTFTDGIGSPPIDNSRTSLGGHPTFISNTGNTTISNNLTVANNPAVLLSIDRNPMAPPTYSSGANINNAGGVSPFQYNPTPPRRRKRNSVVTLLIIVLVLIILVGSVGFALSYYVGNNATPTSVASTQAPSVTTAIFTVQSVTMSVNPTSIPIITCGTYITVTYIATFVVSSTSSGGTIQFTYTVNNGRSSSNATLTFNSGETSKSYFFTWSGYLPFDHTYPRIGEVMTTSPNQITSQGIQPTGQCIE